MSRKLQIPSLEDMDTAKLLPKNDQISSHFKSSRLVAGGVGATATSSSASSTINLTSSTSISTSTKTSSFISSHYVENTRPGIVSTVAAGSISSSKSSSESIAGPHTTATNITKSNAAISLGPTIISSRSGGSNQATKSNNVGASGAAGDISTISVCSTGEEAKLNRCVDDTAEKKASSTVTSRSDDVSSAGAAGTSRSLTTNAIIVNSRQKGNPILKFVRRVPWQFGDIIPDYQVGPSSCVLYLSLKYHCLNPNYIHERLKQLANSFNLRVLLVQVDVKDPHHSLKELAAMCILADCTLILAFTHEEAGQYLETYKSFENKPPDMIMEKTDSDYLTKMTDALTSVKKVNRTDAVTLLTAFGSFEKITGASEEDISLCLGLGPQKAQRLHKVFHQPFTKQAKTS